MDNYQIYIYGVLDRYIGDPNKKYISDNNNFFYFEKYTFGMDFAGGFESLENEQNLIPNLIRK
ncbi:hypothetical protein MtrunA17_Chr3g0133381 [Medicago truncatula]|uniref:Uncharacterized protein n=1 Tax=Medicago truncatula TaxID=3880 RepID=A0A396IX00_MEDTR|nr:hypothetical protein MtrunA17_Chr3g0133381 [Medicago truncatula]